MQYAYHLGPLPPNRHALLAGDRVYSPKLSRSPADMLLRRVDDDAVVLKGKAVRLLLRSCSSLGRYTDKTIGRSYVKRASITSSLINLSSGFEFQYLICFSSRTLAIDLLSAHNGRPFSHPSSHQPASAPPPATSHNHLRPDCHWWRARRRDDRDARDSQRPYRSDHRV